MNATPSNRILAIDDNRAIHDDYRKILCPGKGAIDAAEADFFGEATSGFALPEFQIDSAFQGLEGVELLRQAIARGEPYALAFVDVQMPPGIDGVETAERLWALCPDLQIVICTAYSDYSWEEMLGRLGHRDRLLVLKKPFTSVEALQIACALSEKWTLTRQARLHLAETERIVAERTAQLHQSEAHFRVIAENVADLIAVVDAQGAHTYHSPSYEKALGLSPEELTRTPPAANIHPDDQMKVVLATQHSFASGVGQVLEYRMQHRDGSWRELEAHANPVRNARGEIEYLVMVARDVTQRRQMEVQLRHAQKMESIGQLAAGIAHEINTPTQYIGDNTHFVQDGFRDLAVLLAVQARLLAAAKQGPISPELVAEVEAAAAAADVDYLVAEIPRAIEQSIQGVQRVAKIVGAMKEFSHPGTDEKTAIDLNRAIESTLTVASNEWKYAAEMVTDFDSSLPPVPCLPGEFNQVILNLVVNASHAIADVVGDGSRGKGRITVSTRADGEWVEVRVGDTGSGVPEEIRRKIFDPFFTTKGVGKGTGQGLAIAHSVVVDKHGGEIRLESEVGKGTTFIVRLPLRAPAAERMAA